MPFERHWPPDFPTTRKEGSNRPAIPPSVFDVPKSFTPQTSKTIPRWLNERKIDFESRQPQISPKIEIDPEVICNWDAFTKYCKSLPFYTVEGDQYVCLTKLEGMPPRTSYSIQINEELKVKCFNHSTAIIPTRHLVGKFSAKLETFSQLISIIEMMDTLQPNLGDELIAASKHLKELNADNADQYNYNRIHFICDQMELNAVRDHRQIGSIIYNRFGC